MLDANILDNLSKRMKVVNKIGTIKKNHNVSVLQSKRWNEILEKMILNGESVGLNEEFISKIFKVIHQESINEQDKVINS